jgi:hypothetical protein
MGHVGFGDSRLDGIDTIEEESGSYGMGEKNT